MPELPDVQVYVEALRTRVRGRRLADVLLKSPFLLRSVEPPLSAARGRSVRDVRRLGKRVVLELEPTLFLVLHLMIAGRLHWKAPGSRPTRRNDLALFSFEDESGPCGGLLLTEAGTQRRASLHLAADEAALRAHDRGGLEPLETDAATFGARLASSRHTLKRALCDPGLFSGIGNAYSDEILHAARLSPFLLARKLDGEQLGRLHAATVSTLSAWIERLRAAAGEGFPEKVTAFRPQMAVHGRFRQPCPVCGAPVQRVVRAANEINYCPGCQTGGRILRDRALSRLLKDDWPETLEEL